MMATQLVQFEVHSIVRGICLVQNLPVTRLVRCPICLAIFQEQAGLTVYKCGGCHITLRGRAMFIPGSCKKFTRYCITSGNDFSVFEEALQAVPCVVLPGSLPITFLKVITQNFSEEKELGRGGSGVVYKGTFTNGNVIAVKKLFQLQLGSDDEFERQSVSYLVNLKHQNIVPLKGYCAEVQGKLLCFEYLNNRTLLEHISGSGRPRPMDWSTRMAIAKGIVRALTYLHDEMDIIHGNLTSRNVLLNEQSQPKISDYGLFRLMTTATNSKMLAAAREQGYCAPELSNLLEASTKTDVYSLGIIILELLTGKSPGDIDLLRLRSSDVVFDEELMRGREAGPSDDELVGTLNLALQCVAPSPSVRPLAREVLEALEQILLRSEKGTGTGPSEDPSSPLVQPEAREELGQIRIRPPVLPSEEPSLSLCLQLEASEDGVRPSLEQPEQIHSRQQDWAGISEHHSPLVRHIFSGQRDLVRPNDPSPYMQAEDPKIRVNDDDVDVQSPCHSRRQPADVFQAEDREIVRQPEHFHLNDDVDDQSSCHSRQQSADLFQPEDRETVRQLEHFHLNNNVDDQSSCHSRPANFFQIEDREIVQQLEHFHLNDDVDDQSLCHSRQQPANFFQAEDREIVRQPEHFHLNNDVDDQSSCHSRQQLAGFFQTKDREIVQQPEHFYLNDDVDDQSASHSMQQLTDFFQQKSMSNGLPRDIPFHQLEEITAGFSKEHKLGNGAFGEVYMGVHKDGEKIAVKMLYDMPGTDEEKFINEFKNLANLQHQNIVRLVGYCHETQKSYVEYDGRFIFAERIRRALCFEYMHHGSLEKHLYDECHGLDWNTRYTLIKGICNGLKYLHEELQSPIYHLDLKPANILLDENMLPKIADFGLSRLFGEGSTQITKSSLGTLGYLPPEYIERNIISNKFDIFSLGVVMIKIMAGPSGYTRSAEMSPKEFVELVHENWTKRIHAMHLLESYSNLLESYSKQVKICMEIALSSVDVNRHNRPSIGDIIKKLNETDYNSEIIRRTRAHAEAGAEEQSRPGLVEPGAEQSKTPIGAATATA